MRVEADCNVRVTVEIPDDSDMTAEYGGASDAVYEAVLAKLPLGVELDDVNWTRVPS